MVTLHFNTRGYRVETVHRGTGAWMLVSVRRRFAPNAKSERGETLTS